MNSSFGKTSYYQSTISKITISGEKINNKEFEECLFEKINFTDCVLEKCRFINCKFKDCLLSAIKPVDSLFTDIEFEDSKVMGLDWTLAKGINTLSFVNCQINYSNFRYLKLPKIKIVDCVAKEADFTESDLSEGNFSGTDFEGSRFLKTNLSKADFTKAINYSIDVKNNIIKKAKFSFPQAMSLLGSLDISVEY